MADNSVKFLTGSISDLQAKNTNGTPKVPIVPGRVYFAVDTDRNYGYIAYDVSASQRLVMSTRAELSDRVSHDLTLGDKSYNGSADVDILGSDLHRLSASNYLGITNTNITTSPGITTASVYIIAEKKNKTAVVGNLVIYNNKEYYWSGGAGWKPVGTASFKLRQNPISSPSASSSTISFIDTVSQDENGIITATKKTVRNATASQSGVVTTAEQTFGGLKIFNNGIKLGSNINMGDAGTPSSYPFVGNKITWTGGTDGAEIYYRLDSSDAGRLFLNMTDDTNALIALAYNGTAKSYINPSTPSFYPATSNTGSLGTSSNKWANIYATTIHGNLDGNANTATNATTATNLSAAGTWTWANGTTAGPTATLVLGGKTTNVGAIPSASTSQSGIVTTGAQSFAGVKTFTNKIVLKDGNQAGAQIGAAYITTASATNGEVVLQNGHLRFGGSDWDYNQWAGLKYDHTNKKIVLGLADGSEFTANSAQSGGTFKLVGISTVDLNKTASIRNLAVGGGIYWNPYVESSSDGSDAASITVLKSGAAGGTELRIQQANDSTDIINLVSPSYIYFNSKQAFQINDSWLRVNPNGGFSSGTLFSRLLRADAELQARDIGLYNANQFRTGRWYNVATGTAGDGSNSGTMGAVYLELGNGTAQSAASGAGGGNAKGYLRLYGSSTAVGTLEFDNTYFRPSADIYFVNNSSSTSGWANGIRGQVGSNDYWRVGGGATGSNSGYMEIATADDTNEPIYVRQYSGVFGTLNTTLTLLDASHNTIIPNALTVGTISSQAANYKFYVNGTSYFNGNTTHNGIDYFANGTTYYINNSADANLRRGIFSGTSNGDTAASSFFNTGALEIREAGRVGNGQTSFNYAPRIGFHWSGRIAGSLSFHNDGVFYFRKQNGTDRATIDANVNGNSSTATQFASNKTITLSGDVSGSASSKGGWSITTSIGAGKVTNAMLAGSIENGKLVNSKITLAGNDVSLGGSLSADTLRISLGLSNALHFIGIATVAITDGSTTDPKISGYTIKTSGDVIIDKDSAYEYIWTGSKWERLGGDGSYKVVQSAVADPAASGTSNTFIATISQDANGKITATKKTVAVTNNAPTLAWGTTSTIGTVAGTSLQVKMPANPNVDTKVTQNAIKASDYTNWRPLIWGASNSSTEGFTPSTVTDGVYTAQTLSCQPSSGTIKANTFKGNATSATKLKNFGLTADTIDNVTHVGLIYSTIGSYTGPGFASSDAMILSMSWNDSNNYGAQIALDDTTTPNMYVRNKSGSWSAWSKVLLSTNYTDYTVKKDGTGASGTWGINISGNASTATGLNAIIANDKLPDRLREYHSSGMTLDSTACGWYYASSSNTSPFTTASDFMVMNQGYSTDWGSQIATDFRSNRLAVRNKNNGTWNSWVRVLDQNTGVARAHYGTESGSENYILITINKEIYWMLNFTIKLYQSYVATDIQVSGYNYGANHWYSPNAVILGSTTTSGIKVYFGYTDNFKLWVALDGGTYTGVDVLNAVNGYQQMSLDDAFTITRVSSLPGTLQTTITAYRPYYRDEIVVNTDKLDGYHENSFLRYRDTISGSGGTSHLDSLWSQIGIRQYNNALPDGMADNATYTYGAVISLPGNDSRFDIWYNHGTSASNDGLRYRTGWNDDKKTWATILDSVNYGSIADGRYVKKSGDTMTGDLTAPTFHGTLDGNATGLKYHPTLNTDDDINNFNTANTFKAALWNGTSSPGVSNGVILSGAWNSNSYGFQIAIDDDPGWYIALRQRTTDGWRAWKRIPMGDGTGASGTWNISINGSSASCTGNAATATKLTTARTISLTGSVTGSGTFDGSGNLNINTTKDTNILSRGDIIDTHIEGHQTIILDSGNDLGAFYERGGTCNAYEVDISTTNFTGSLTSRGTLSSIPASVFNGLSGYPGGNYSGDHFAVYDLALPNGLSYSKIFWWSFGTGSWKPSKIRILASHNGVDWTLNYTSDSCPSYGKCGLSVPSGVTCNYIRIVVNQYSRLSCFGARGYSSTGLNMTYMNRCQDDWIYRSVTPAKNDYYNLGSSSNRWNNIYGAKVYGAVWNDYAEFRQSDINEPGRVVVENGDGTLSLSTKRLQRGAEVISDTYGFAIGETDDCKTPIAATGRVLVYTYEPIEEYKSKIGWPVCSGPNGTVSIMSEEEEEKYPSRIIGTISEIPTYEEWGTGKVKVDGRVWIRIK